MRQDQTTILAELREIVSAIETHAQAHDTARLKAGLKRLDGWARKRLVHPVSAPVEITDEVLELRQKLRTSRGTFDSLVASYKGILDAFETFRGTIDLVQRVKRLEELPAVLASIKELRSLHTLELILDQEIFAGRVPKGVGRASARTIRERLKQFSPAPHAPRLYLGDIGRIEEPGFFFGQNADHATGSCFIFALGHKYQHGKIIGVVAAYDPDPTRYGPDKATDFLSHFCDILACTLIIALEHAQLEELTVRDSLTGVNNRSYLERHAPRILDFAVRKGLPVHLLFIDLNGFKAVNDTLGHEAGDAILTAVARAIQTMIRRYDIFVRLGGDEFVILLPDTTESMTLAFVLRLRQTLTDIDVGNVCALDTNLRISASVGISRHEPGQSLDELIRVADQNMYADKTGKNAPDGPHPGLGASLPVPTQEV